jgi:hypothetical protein
MDAPENLEEIPEHLMENYDASEESTEEAKVETLSEEEKLKRVEKINKDFENPLSDLISGE